MNIRQIILIVALAAAPPFVAISAFAALVTADRSPIVTKQSRSAYRLCQAELRRRMGGTRSIVNILTTDLTSTATTIRLTGQGSYRQDQNSRSQPFNFACMVNLEQNRVISLSYNFTSNSTSN